MTEGSKAKAVSAKQQAANRKNAKKSTGPCTAQGTARSAKNAMTHGIYARPTPVPGGEFAEDPDEIEAFTEEVVEGLAPRNGLERMLATRVATALLHAARLDRYSALQIAKHSRVGLLDRANASSLNREQTDAETAAANVISSSLERVSILDARVGRELERALTIYKTTRKILSGDDAEEE